MRWVVWLWARGISTSEMARQMRIGHSTVRVHLYQARRRLAADSVLLAAATSSEP
ncbi:LuxR C-terminal-related transcriptional regulator [Streptomyces djakartensis]|uniref:LuxR C-terminal-related transcriptional regulator n=1 Tax=Streptomyces djakartensis TaxID=68193 RepID=UPI0034E0166E